nr:DUF6519 domain-containing protein [uncultured Sphingomonas sp.]
MTIRNDATRQRMLTGEKRAFRAVVPRQGQVLLDTDFDDLARLTNDRLETGDADIIGARGRLAVPALSSGFAVSSVNLGGGKIDAEVSPGRGYLDGWLIENRALFTLSAAGPTTAQPHPWNRPAQPTPAIVAIRAVIRLVDPVEEPALADRALGDAQASGRSLVDWQVFTIPVTTPKPLNCSDVPDSDPWKAINKSSTGRLQFQKTTPVGPTSPCELIESGGYSRLENLLYRVEVHGGEQATGAPDRAIDGPRFKLDKLQLKLSRRNASVLARVTKVAGNTFTVSPSALDPRNWFAEGQLAELVSVHDDVDPTLADGKERMFRIAKVEDDKVELLDGAGTATVAAVGANDDGSWYLRLWDSLPEGETLAIAKPDGTGTKSLPISLGDGIAITLGAGAGDWYRRGDYWTCAMRADGEIEWVEGQELEPLGPARRYAPLAVINAAPMSVEDCRIAIASLADKSLLYRGGDGQEAMPDPTKPTQRVALAAPLRVAVMRGEQPVVGATVRFRLEGLPSGKNAQLAFPADASPTSSGASIDVLTNAKGEAAVAWEIDPTVARQTVQAFMPVTAGAAQQTITFTANLSQASETGFDPKSVPIFAGITDVQRALEALAGMQQAGCATYVLTPDNWRSVLKSLKAGEDAKLCFQRGLYEADDCIVLQDLGHISMCGAGDASRISVAKGECAIRFERCASVHVSHLSMAAPEGMSKGSRGPMVPSRNGTLTIVECPEVQVSDASFSCGGQAHAERTCLAVRGSEKIRLLSARIIGNRFEVGFMQDGILVTEADHCVIENNELRAAPFAEGTDFVRLLLSDTLRMALLRAIVPDGPITLGSVKTGPRDLRFLRTGNSYALFESPIPQEEWDKIVEAVAFADGTEPSAYAESIFKVASTNADLINKYMPDILRIERALSLTTGSNARAFLLRTSDIEMVDKRTALARIKAVRESGGVGELLADFTSVMSKGDWSRLLKEHPIERGWTPDQTGEHLRKLARMLLSDAKLRDKFGSLKGWFDTKRASLPPFGRQAITCGGRSFGDAIIRSNRAEGFTQAVHVGTSFQTGHRETASARSVHIAANIAAIELAGDMVYSPAAIFVGNANHVRIADNCLRKASEFSAMTIASGIRLWGHFGRFIAIEKNVVAVGRNAIQIRTLDQPSDDQMRIPLWLVADNLGEAHTSSTLLRVPPYVEKRFNKP